MHKLMLVDNDRERSDSLESALREAGYHHTIRVGQDENLLSAVRQHKPDIILIDMQSPDRDTLESLRNVNKEMPKPIVFFAEQSDLETTRAAISAGVSAYIVDDLPGKRLKSVLEVAIARFQEHQKLKEELEDYKTRLQDRKDVDKAKGILMQHRNLSEEDAYQLLRKMAMDRNMKIGEAARNFVAAMALLGGQIVMKQDLRIGFLPLTDCAVLVAAQERGFFEKYGLNVTLQREVSWANIRDRVAFGELDAAHMLAPMPMAATLGIDGLGIPMQTALSIGLNGSAITLATELMQGIRTHFPEYLHTSPMRATGLKALLALEPQRKLVLGCVYPFSQHYYLLHAWLLDGGLEIGRDVEIQVIPPSQMVSALTAGEIDGYCAGEPWNQVAVQRNIGCVAASSYGLWHNGPEKVVGVTQTWAETNPHVHQALIKALLEAAAWADDRHNRVKLAEVLARPQYLDIPLELIRPPLLGRYRYAADEPERFMPDFNVFARYAANFPWHSHGRYFLRQMQVAGQLTQSVAEEDALLASVYRTDLYRQAAGALGYPYPTGDEIPLLDCTTPWVLHEASQPIAMGSNHIALPQLRTN